MNCCQKCRNKELFAGVFCTDSSCECHKKLCQDISPTHNNMKEKKYYLTKQERPTIWNYVGDPLNPQTTLDAGLVEVKDKSEIKVDDFGAYVIRYIPNNEGMEWEKVFDAKVKELGFHLGYLQKPQMEKLKVCVASLLSLSKQQGVEQGRKEVLDFAHDLIGEMPTNSMEDIAYALRRYENLSEREKEHVRNRDNGLYIKMVGFSVKERFFKDLLNRFNTSK